MSRADAIAVLRLAKRQEFPTLVKWRNEDGRLVAFATPSRQYVLLCGEGTYGTPFEGAVAMELLACGRRVA